MVESDEAWYDGDDDQFMTVAEVCEDFSDIIEIHEPRLRPARDIQENIMVCAWVIAVLSGIAIGIICVSMIFGCASALMIVFFAWLISGVVRKMSSTWLNRELKHCITHAQRMSGEDFNRLIDDPLPGSLCVFDWREVWSYLPTPDEYVFTIGGRKSIVFFTFADDHDRVMFALSR